MTFVESKSFTPLFLHHFSPLQDYNLLFQECSIRSRALLKRKKLSRINKLAKFLHFARINFRESSFLTYFAGINFRESGYMWLAFFDLTFVFYRHFSRLMFCMLCSSILHYVLFIIKRYNAYQCTRKTKHCLYLYP